MKNKIIEFVYFILLTILSGLLCCAYSIETGYQIAGQLVENNFDKNSEVENIFKSNLSLKEAVIYTKVPRGLIVSINSDIFFEDGKDIIKENSKIFLDEIGSILKQLDKPCIIEGNSKSSQVESPYYNTNWEISIVRAEKIARYLIEKQQIDPQKIQTVGFGEMMPLTKSNLDFTQRIDFVILNYELKELKNVSTQ